MKTELSHRKADGQLSVHLVRATPLHAHDGTLTGGLAEHRIRRPEKCRSGYYPSSIQRLKSGLKRTVNWMRERGVCGQKAKT